MFTPKRIALAALAAAAPLVACGSSPEERSATSSEHLYVNPLLQCQSGSQFNVGWKQGDGTVDSPPVGWWYSFGGIQTDSLGTQWETFAGIDAQNNQNVDFVVWIHPADEAYFRAANLVCADSSAFSVTHPPSDGTGPMGGGGGGPKCQEPPGTPAGGTCLNWGEYDQINFESLKCGPWSYQPPVVIWCAGQTAF